MDGTLRRRPASIRLNPLAAPWWTREAAARTRPDTRRPERPHTRLYEAQPSASGHSLAALLSPLLLALLALVLVPLIGLVAQALPLVAPASPAAAPGGPLRLTLRADLAGIPDAQQARVAHGVASVIERRLDAYGAERAAVSWEPSGAVEVRLGAADDPAALEQLLTRPAHLEFRECCRAGAWVPALAEDDRGQPTTLGGEHLVRADVATGPDGSPAVVFDLDHAGTRQFGAISARLVGQQLAIFLDDQPISTSTVREAVTSGRVQISGSLTAEQARALAAQLNAGALPVPVSVESVQPLPADAAPRPAGG